MKLILIVLAWALFVVLLLKDAYTPPTTMAQCTTDTDCGCDVNCLD